ncbi:hypothetical protein ABI59_06280 [Acidobacteria bacterium Mor1]|nr:hypothetical protein ABI59_06280 [Acidobacteria bacterium Mor1]
MQALERGSIALIALCALGTLGAAFSAHPAATGVSLLAATLLPAALIVLGCSGVVRRAGSGVGVLLVVGLLVGGVLAAGLVGMLRFDGWPAMRWALIWLGPVALILIAVAYAATFERLVAARPRKAESKRRAGERR